MKQWNEYINQLKDYDLEEQDETELDASLEEQREDEEQDKKLRKEAEKKKARLRTSGPYRKAHANR